MIDSADVAPQIKKRPCESCGEKIDPDNFVLTFYRGEFITLHNECDDFIYTATKKPRPSTDMEETK